VVALTEAFHRVHERVYAMRDPGSAVEFVNWKGRVSVKVAPPFAKARPIARTAAPAATRSRQAFFGEGSHVETPVYRGGELPLGAAIVGPAVIEEETTTIVIYPGMTAEVSETGHFIVHIH
jgi:N-methylhydantoinase A